MLWYQKKEEEILQELSSSAQGLTEAEAAKKLEDVGPNELAEEEKRSFLSKLLAQFKDTLILILMGAAVVSMFVGEVADAIIILAIVVINALLGLYQEGKAEKALEALKKMASPEAKVIREGKTVILPSAMIVPGDIVVLETGDIVPADLRLTESANLKIDESSLTGESVPVEKDASILYAEDREIGDRENMAYTSTIVSYGRGHGIAVETGHNTEIGKIATTLSSYGDEMTPLQKKLDQMGKMLGIVVLVVCAIVFAVGLFYGNSLLEMFMTAIALAVAAIPEGLPAIVTVVLSLGMGRMAERNAIVKKLLAVETLGTTTYICSDKTGTLTQNEMTVTKIYLDGQELDVTGTGYAPTGAIQMDGADVLDEKTPSLYTMLSIAALTNDAKIEENEGLFRVIGDPTEGALVTLAGKKGITPVEHQEKYPRVSELPFDSERKMMSTFHTGFLPEKVVSFTKGAPDIVLSLCKYVLKNGERVEMTDADREDILHYNSKFAKSALRVLAYALKEFDQVPEKPTPETVEVDMTFVGITGMIDPPREEAKEAIALCKEAGIVPVMITGDYKDTAFAIAKQLGMAEREDQSIMGKDLNGLTDAEMRELVKEKRVYARVSPEHKVAIVTALKENGEITAMTGDGVNDALAIKRADIGISMGITGTDVAKSTADVILTDDNFASIVAAVKEGRIIYSNIKKFVFFLLSCNIGEILVVLISILMNLPVPFIPIQLLWLNLVTDSFPALALGVEPGEDDIMEQPPRSPDEAIIDRDMRIGIALQAAAISISVITVYRMGLAMFPGHVEGARTMAFATLILAELLRSYSNRSEHFTLWHIGIFSNMTLVYATLVSFALMIVVLYVPFMQTLFHTITLGVDQWIRILPAAFIPLIVGEVYKMIRFGNKAKKHV